MPRVIGGMNAHIPKRRHKNRRSPVIGELFIEQMLALSTSTKSARLASPLSVGIELKTVLGANKSSGVTGFGGSTLPRRRRLQFWDLVLARVCVSSQVLILSFTASTDSTRGNRDSKVDSPVKNVADFQTKWEFE